MREAEDRSTDSTNMPLGSRWTKRVVPPLWWATAQLAALSFHIPLTLLIGPSSAQASASSVYWIGAGLTAASIGVYLLFGTRNSGWRSLALVSVTVFYFWQSSGIAETGLLSGGIAKIAIYGVSVAAALKFAEKRLFKVASFVMSVVFASTLALFGVYDELKAAPAVVAAQTPVGELHLANTPDIVLIILDGYGRADVIRDLYKGDNANFVSDLEKAGFQVSAESVANYPMTHFSVPALLNMSYMHPDGAVVGRKDQRILASAIAGDNALVEILKANGYTYVHAEADNSLNRCGPQVDICLRSPKPDMTAQVLLARTPIGSLIHRRTGDSATALNLRRIAQLTSWKETTAGWPSGPVFAFFHLTLPHPPLYLDSDCSVRVDPELGARVLNNGEMSPDVLEKRRLAWMSQVECANAAIRSFVEQLNDETVTVIVSDHGPDMRFWTSLKEHGSDDLDKVAVRERFSNLTAIRLPGQCQSPSENISLVNVFRFVLGCLSGRELDLLPNRLFVGLHGGPVVELKNSPQDADE